MCLVVRLLALAVEAHHTLAFLPVFLGHIWLILLLQ